MSKHSDKAVALFTEKGFNCAQSVSAAFADETGLSEETLLTLSSAFGGGFGRMREVCGAACGMTIILGALCGYSDTQNPDAKIKLYECERELIDKFKKANGSFICREILGAGKAEVGGTPSERTPAFYHERPCINCVRSAAEILDEFLEKTKKQKNDRIRTC